MKKPNVLIRFKADTGKFVAVVLLSTDRKMMFKLKDEYNKNYPDFRYEVFWPEKTEEYNEVQTKM